ncbi:MAG: hypothetical protein FIB02_08610 [Desulfuromonas sp.]|nr:hypothetical protein [Desulfuromonas sp.]
MKIHLAAVALAILNLAACTTIPDIVRYSPKVETRFENIQNYRVGEPMRAYVGEKMVENGAIKYSLVSEGQFHALQSISAGAYLIIEGKTYPALFSDKADGGVFVGGERLSVGIKVDSDGYLMHPRMFYTNVGGWQDHTLVTVGKVGERIFEPTPANRKYSPDSYKYEVVYLGKSGDDIRASYREYKEDIACPAFYQYLSYNLKSSDVIRIKHIRIQVIQATNEEIEYVVLED